LYLDFLDTTHPISEWKMEQLNYIEDSTLYRVQKKIADRAEVRNYHPKFKKS
jgi:hypothetical protein